VTTHTSHEGELFIKISGDDPDGRVRVGLRSPELCISQVISWEDAAAFATNLLHASKAAAFEAGHTWQDVLEAALSRGFDRPQ
jgi:hypothetical protein